MTNSCKKDTPIGLIRFDSMSLSELKELADSQAEEANYTEVELAIAWQLYDRLTEGKLF